MEAGGFQIGDGTSPWRLRGFAVYPYPCRGMSKNDSRRDAETQRKWAVQSSSSSQPSVIRFTGAHAPDFLSLSAAHPLCARFLLHECRLSDSCSGELQGDCEAIALWRSCGNAFFRPSRGWVFMGGTQPSAHALGYHLSDLRAWGRGLGQGCVDRIRVVGVLRGRTTVEGGTTKRTKGTNREGDGPGCGQDDRMAEV